MVYLDGRDKGTSCLQAAASDVHSDTGAGAAEGSNLARLALDHGGGEQCLDLRQARSAIAASAHVGLDLSRVGELVVGNGALDRVAADSETRADQWPRLFCFGEHTLGHEGQSLSG